MTLYIFDLDDTLVTSYMNRTDRDFFAPIEILPGRREKLAELRAAGHQVAIATNQAAVAFVWKDQRPVTVADVWQKIDQAVAQLGLPEETCIAVCFAHPKSRDARWSDPREIRRRKPCGAMIWELMDEILGTHEYHRDQVVMVGDREEDLGAAQDAGVEFVKTAEFFGDPEPTMLAAEILQP